MNQPQQFTKIVTDDSLMEAAAHGDETYPFRYYYENMALFDFHRIDWHWHSELEFVYVQRGNVEFDIGTEHFTLGAGNGVMINARILHRMQSAGEAVIPNFLFHPVFLAAEGSRIYENYVRPVIAAAPEYIIFRPEIPWQAEVLTLMRDIIAAHAEAAVSELRISVLVGQLWLLVTENQTFVLETDPMPAAARTRLQLMMRHIHAHYAEDLTLADIAAAAGVSKSNALQLFRSNLHISPVNYLIEYRLKQAARLLVNTEKKIAAAAGETGFHSVDYFCRTFRKAYGLTPTEYRTAHGK